MDNILYLNEIKVYNKDLIEDLIFYFDIYIYVLI